jgi:spermidine synthase
LHDFYREVRRILRPDGAFAAWGYDLCAFKDNAAANNVLQELYEGTLGPYWSERRRLVEKQYEGEIYVHMIMPFCTF